MMDQAMVQWQWLCKSRRWETKSKTRKGAGIVPPKNHHHDQDGWIHGKRFRRMVKKWTHNLQCNTIMEGKIEMQLIAWISKKTFSQMPLIILIESLHCWFPNCKTVESSENWVIENEKEWKSEYDYCNPHPDRNFLWESSLLQTISERVSFNCPIAQSDTKERDHSWSHLV